MSKVQKIIIATCLLGYFLVYQAISFTKTNQSNDEIGFCILKKVTNIPCPSCGSTRALLLFLDGQIIKSVNENPFAILIFIYLLIAPFWLLFDLILKKKTIDTFYYQIEDYLKKRYVFIPLILLVILNWIWNISKGL
jgi:hypothetical protein